MLLMMVRIEAILNFLKNTIWLRAGDSTVVWRTLGVTNTEAAETSRATCVGNHFACKSHTLDTA